MILASLLWIASDLAVSGLVVTVDAVGRCPFNTSGVYTVMMENFRPNISVEPSPFGGLYQVISQARITSLNNGGLGGIYGKVNGDLGFRADSFDIVGQWKCQDSGDDRSYAANTSIDTILQDLNSHELLFTEYSYICDVHNGDNTNGHFVVWTTSEPQKLGLPIAKPWDVRMAVDMSGDVYAQQVLKTFLCHMDAPSLEGILWQTSVEWWIPSWCEELSGRIYTTIGPVPMVATDPGAVVESLLDGLITMAGAAWNLTEWVVSDPTQGCLVPRAEVSWLVILLFVLVAFATASMALYWITLGMLIHQAAKWRSPQRVQVVEDYTPNGLLGWMVQAVRETGIAQEVGFKNLKEWSFGCDSDGQRIRLRSSRGAGEYFQQGVV